MASAVDNLIAARDNAIATLALEEAYQAAHGPKPSYTLDGESYQWQEWREGMVRFIQQLNVTIQQLQPFIVVSRGRS